MKATLLCISTGNSITMPKAESRMERGTRYHCAPPGMIYYWGATAGEPQHIPDPTIPRVYTPPSQEGPFQYGLCVIEDLIYEKDDLTQNEKTLSQAIMDGRERGRDIEGRRNEYGWWRWGVLMIAGERPTQEEIQRAIQNRLNFAEHRVSQAIEKVHAGRSGKGFHSNWEIVDKEWAKELGKALPETLEALSRVSMAQPANVSAAPASTNGETAPCTGCYLPIHPKATVCRHCGRKHPDTAEASYRKANAVIPEGLEIPEIINAE